MWFRRWTICLVIGLLASAAVPVSGVSAATPTEPTRSYPLPSDGWGPGRGAMEAMSSSRFHATLTRSGACTSDGAISYLWPAGYRVRFHPTVLLDPRGKIVAHEGQYITVGGGIVGTASWPSAARCYKGGDVFAIQSSVQLGRPGPILDRTFLDLSVRPIAESQTAPERREDGTGCPLGQRVLPPSDLTTKAR